MNRTVFFLCILTAWIGMCCPAGYGERPRFETVGQSLRGYASTLLVQDGLAYVTMGSALVVFDVSDPDSVVEMGRVFAQTCYDANPALISFPGGKYLAVSSDLYGVLIFDVSDCVPGEPSCTPIHKMTLFDPIPGSVTDPGGGVFFQPNPEQDGFLYCANGQRGLKIYRASTTPEGELEGFQLEGVFEPPPEMLPDTIGIGYYANVFVKDDLAYVAAMQSWLHVWDVSDPAAPEFLSCYHSFNPIELSPATDVVVEDDIAFVSFMFLKGIETVDVSVPTNPVHLGHYLAWVNLFHGISLEDREDHYLLAAANSDRGLYLLQISRTGESIDLVDHWRGTWPVWDVSMSYPDFYLANCTGGFTAAEYSGHGQWNGLHFESDLARDLVVVDDPLRGAVAYIADGPRGLVAVDVSDPARPGREQLLDTDGLLRNATGIEYRDDFLYVADEDEGLLVYHLDAPLDLSYRDHEPVNGYPREILIHQDGLYVPAGKGGIVKFTIQNPADPQYVTETTAAGRINNLTMFEGRLYAAGETFSVLDPSGLELLDRWERPENDQVKKYNDVALKRSGDRLFAYTAPTGWLDSEFVAFRIFEILDDPVRIRGGVDWEIRASNYPYMSYDTVRSVEIPENEEYRDMLFVVYENCGVYAFDISNPECPVQLAEYLLSANNNTYEFLCNPNDGLFYNAHGDAGLYIFDYHHVSKPYIDSCEIPLGSRNNTGMESGKKHPE